MPYEEQHQDDSDSTSKVYIHNLVSQNKTVENTAKAKQQDPLADLEASLGIISRKNPRLTGKTDRSEARSADLKALLEISNAVNSTLVLDDILQIVMKKAIELLQAERGFLMLLDHNGKLKFKTAHNIHRETMPASDFKISTSISNEVVRTGKPVFASDAQADERFAKQESILELHLRSIMCVPLKVKDRIIGVAYLDNSSNSKIFLQSDLYLFELFAEQAATAIENAKLYESLLDLKRYNENVVDKTPVGIIATDNELRVTSLNSAAAKILSTSGVEPVRYDPQSAPVPLVSLWSGKDAEYWEKIASEVLRTGDSFQDNKYYFQVGEEQKVLSIKISLLDEGVGENSGLIVVMEDITDKVLLENYVLMSERLVAKGEMAAAIGHELNNYLTIISNNAELMKLNVRRNMLDKLEKNTGAILDNIAKIKRFTDSLMDYSRLEAEIIDYQVSELIEELLLSIRPQKELRHASIEVDIPTNLPVVEMDVGQMHQVLLNLINNAIEAIRDKEDVKARILITASYNRTTDEISIEVADNGPGIKPKNTEKIFEPRFTTKQKGHGLGLSNCKRIMDSHHGSITAISDGCDGATFRITMPVKQPVDAK
jgi:two-component system NtrC family sensor kinase